MKAIYLLFHFFLLIHCSQRNRLIVTHHKTGTMLARKLKVVLTSTKVDLPPLSKSYSIATIGDGISTIGLNEDWTNVVHMMRNPFSMILSSYFYHKTTTESWVFCSIDYGWKFPLCPFKSKYTTIQNTFKYIKVNLNNQLTIHNQTYSFPSTSGHTYQSYLNKLNSIQGIVVEMIRVNQHDIPSMIDDFLLMLKMQALFNEPNHFQNHLQRKYINLCLESLTVMTENGKIVNSEEGLKQILFNLDINVTSEDLLIISQWVNHDTEHHQTNHTSSSRSTIESVLRWYDKNKLNGLIHYYEKMIMCGNVGGNKEGGHSNNGMNGEEGSTHHHTHHMNNQTILNRN